MYTSRTPSSEGRSRPSIPCGKANIESFRRWDPAERPGPHRQRRKRVARVRRRPFLGFDGIRSATRIHSAGPSLGLPWLPQSPSSIPVTSCIARFHSRLIKAKISSLI